MTCAEIEERLSRYADGELSQWSRWKVELHLRDCRCCSATLQDLQSVDLALLQCSAADPAPTYLTGAVMNRLPAMPPAWKPRPGGMRLALGLGLAGVQLVVLYGAYWWGFARGQSQGIPGVTAALRARPAADAPKAGPGVFSQPRREVKETPRIQPRRRRGAPGSLPLPFRPGTAVFLPLSP